jgi:hypothetical protein
VSSVVAEVELARVSDTTRFVICRDRRNLADGKLPVRLERAGRTEIKNIMMQLQGHDASIEMWIFTICTTSPKTAFTSDTATSARTARA